MANLPAFEAFHGCLAFRTPQVPRFFIGPWASRPAVSLQTTLEARHGSQALLIRGITLDLLRLPSCLQLRRINTCFLRTPVSSVPHAVALGAQGPHEGLDRAPGCNMPGCATPGALNGGNGGHR